MRPIDKASKGGKDLNIKIKIVVILLFSALLFSTFMSITPSVGTDVKPNVGEGVNVGTIEIEKEHIIIYPEEGGFGVIDVYFFSKPYRGDLAIALPNSVMDDQIEVVGNMSYSGWSISKGRINNKIGDISDGTINILAIEDAEINGGGHLALTYFIQSDLFSRIGDGIVDEISELKYPKLEIKSFLLIVPENIEVDVISGYLSQNDTILMRGEIYKVYRGKETENLIFKLKTSNRVNEGDRENSVLSYMGVLFLVIGIAVLFFNIMRKGKGNGEGDWAKESVLEDVKVRDSTTQEPEVQEFKTQALKARESKGKRWDIE